MGGELDDSTCLATLASEFRKRMSVGQSADQCNAAFRKQFYDYVVNRAREVRSQLLHYVSLSDFMIFKLITDVTKYMRHGPSDHSSSIATSGNKVGGSKKLF